MTASVQTSIASFNKYGRYYRTRRRSAVVENIYQASVQDFDGCEYDYNVTAESFEAAAAQIESLAYGDGIQIYNINIYQVG